MKIPRREKLADAPRLIWQDSARTPPADLPAPKPGRARGPYRRVAIAAAALILVGGGTYALVSVVGGGSGSQHLADPPAPASTAAATTSASNPSANTGPTPTATARSTATPPAAATATTAPPAEAAAPSKPAAAKATSTADSKSAATAQQWTGEITGFAGLCVDDRDAGTQLYNPVQMWTCVNDVNQQWTVFQSDGAIKVFGLCLDVNGGNSADGTTVDLFTCNGSGAQIWVPRSNGELFNPQSGKCLDDTDAGPAGTQVQIWDCLDDVNQKWALPAGAQ